MDKNDKKNWMQNLTDVVESFILKLFEKIGLKSFVNWYMEHQEGMRYLVFGALATLVNIVVFDIFFYVVPVTYKNTGNSNVIAWVIAAVFAYFTNKLCVFDSKTQGSKALVKEVISFFGFRLLTLIVDQIIMIIAIDKLKLNAGFMKVISNIIVIILNFVFSKLFIFKKGTEE